jgi:glycine cleavage system H lipoate-binding protein
VLVATMSFWEGVDVPGHALRLVVLDKIPNDISIVAGTITAVNDAVAADSSLVNSDPYGSGWLFTVRVSSLGELISADAYAALIAE